MGGLRISVLSIKGGAGKSTIALTTALELTEMGRNVLLIDRDLLGYSSQLAGIRGKGLLASVVEGGNGGNYISEIKRGGTLTILKFYGDGLRFRKDIEAIHERLELRRELRLKYTRILSRKKFDYVIVDNPPLVHPRDEAVKHELDLFRDVYPDMPIRRIYVTDPLKYNLEETIDYLRVVESLSQGGERPMALVINMVPPPLSVGPFSEVINEAKLIDSKMGIVVVPFVEQLFQYSGEIDCIPRLEQIRRFATAIGGGTSYDIVL